MARRSKVTGATGTAVHSYLHLVRRNGLHPYIKWPRATVPKVSSWAVSDLSKAYDWPTDAPGGGVIAIIELGGGWTQADVTQFFTSANLPAPNITDVSVDGTTNSHCNPKNDADGEVALDIQVAGASYAVATGKAANIRVYWSQDITKAVIAATSDGCDVCSISWGADEASWGAADGDALEQAAIAATGAGMVVFAASGDNDSSDGGPGRANVDLPASAPHVIGCGGTHKPHSGEETVWNNDPRKTTGEGTGGGYSTLFPMPSWQAGAPHGPGRLVPDVAANADPNTGYEIILYGASTVVGGTSAVAPLYAGLFASFGTKLGFVTPTLYLNSACFTDITHGNNGAFRGRTGADPCTGLGSPIGASLEERLDPATIHASRVRDVMAENARLRALVASLRVPPSVVQPASYLPLGAVQPTTYVRALAPIAPRLAPAIACTGSVLAGRTAPPRTQITAAVMRNSDNPSIPNPTDATPIIPNLMTPGPDPIFLLAGACMNDPLFQKDGLWMQPEVDTVGTTLGGFVNYIIACYGNHRI
jgi:kumamolisin